MAPPWIIEDLGSIPGTGRCIVSQMTTGNGSSLSLHPIPSSRLKKLGDIGKWSSMRLSLSIRETSVTRIWAVLKHLGWGHQHLNK